MLDLRNPNTLPYFLQQLKAGFVAKEVGKGLSSNDYTDEDKEKVSATIDGKSIYKLLRQAAPRNLLDNSDFSNPVNQRGVTSPYSGAASKNTYFIDRWVTWSTLSSYSLEDGGLAVTNNYTSANQGPMQRVEYPEQMKGKTYTLAAYYDDDIIKCGTVTIPESVTGSELYLTAVHCSAGSVGLNLMVGVDFAYVYFKLVVGAGETRKIKWCAVYEGEYTADTLPKYQPKGYGAELRECQRYYYQSWDTAEGFTDNGPALIAASGWALPPMAYFPVEMRIKPTVTIYSDEGTLNVVRLWDNSSSPEVTGANRISRTRFGVGANNTLAVGKLYKFHFSASADL